MKKINKMLEEDEKIYWHYETKVRILKFAYHLQIGIAIFAFYFFIVFLPSIFTEIQWIPFLSIIIGPCLICGIFQDVRRTYYEDLVFLRELGMKRKHIRKEKNSYWLTNKRWIQKDLQSFYLIQKYNLYSSEQIEIKGKYISIELQKIKVVIADYQAKNKTFYLNVRCNNEIDLNKIHFKISFNKDIKQLDILLNHMKNIIQFNFLSRYLKCKKEKKTLVILKKE